MTFTHVHDAAEFLMFRERMERVIDRIARRHAAELRRTWGFESFRNHSAAQLARWARTKGQQQ